METDNYDTFCCRLCGEIEAFENSLFSRKYPHILKQNKFWERPHFQVMLPIGPFCEGHLLIVSKEHALSFGHLGRDVLSELTGLIDEISNFLKKHYYVNRIIFFEHGPYSFAKRGSSCLDHAHMNIMPIADTFHLIEHASIHFSFKPVKLDQLNMFVKKKTPYLFFCCPIEGSFAAEVPFGESQFFRKLLLTTTNEKNWDWNSNPRPDIISKMAVLLKNIE